MNVSDRKSEGPPSSDEADQNEEGQPIAELADSPPCETLCDIT